MGCNNYMIQYREKISDIGENKAKELLKSEIKKDSSLAEKITRWVVGAGAATATGVAVSTGHVHLSPHIMHLINTVGHNVAFQVASMATAAAAVTTGMVTKFRCNRKDPDPELKADQPSTLELT